MRSVLVFMMLVTATLAAIPAASAEASRSYHFSDQMNTGDAPAGTRVLLNVPTTSGTTVTLPANSPQTWADPDALLSPAAINNGNFHFELFFTLVSGNVTIEYGSIEDGTFTAIGSIVMPITSHSRSGVPVVNMGSADGDLTINGNLDAGAFLAIRLTTDRANGLFTDDSALGAETPSTATVPLPELPALILMGLGLATVGVVGIARRKKDA